MFETLSEKGWKFTFKVDAMSPRGFPYSAEGRTPIEAFLKAFGQWCKAASAPAPRATEVKADVRRAPVPLRPAPPKDPQAYLSELVRDLKREMPVEA